MMLIKLYVSRSRKYRVSRHAYFHRIEYSRIENPCAISCVHLYCRIKWPAVIVSPCLSVILWHCYRFVVRSKLCDLKTTAAVGTEYNTASIFVTICNKQQYCKTNHLTCHFGNPFCYCSVKTKLYSYHAQYTSNKLEITTLWCFQKHHMVYLRTARLICMHVYGVVACAILIGLVVSMDRLKRNLCTKIWLQVLRNAVNDEQSSCSVDVAFVFVSQSPGFQLRSLPAAKTRCCWRGMLFVA